MFTQPSNVLPEMIGRKSYCLITPCRNEERYARRTLASVARQSVPPDLWVIVDDGSSDATMEILREHAARLPYLRIVQHQDRGFRKLGGGVIDAFYWGLQQIDLSAFKYLCKLDLDLELPPTYFESLIERMEENPRLGTCSGKPYYRARNGQPISEQCGDENSVGMTKFYRRECFGEIGGFVRSLMWDGIDGHRCRMHGWMAQSWDDPELRFEHLRPMGSSIKNRWIGRMRHGEGQYFMGTSLPYIVASACYRMTHRPLVVGGVAMLIGYLMAAIRQQPRYDDREFQRFLRSFQHQALRRGKAAVVQKIDHEQQAVWQQRHGRPRNPVASGELPETGWTEQETLAESGSYELT